MALRVIAFDATRSDNIVSAYASCPRCLRPIAFELWQAPKASTNQSWFGTSDAKVGGIEILTRSGWEIRETFPQQQQSVAPQSTPADVSRIYLQARSTHQRGEYDAAAMLYRKALETAIKGLEPNGKGSLDARIKALSKLNMIPDAVATWAHEIRGIGNDAAHDADEPSKDEVDAAAEFVEAFLTYAFTMPAKIDNRKSKDFKDILG